MRPIVDLKYSFDRVMESTLEDQGYEIVENVDVSSLVWGPTLGKHKRCLLWKYCLKIEKTECVVLLLVVVVLLLVLLVLLLRLQGMMTRRPQPPSLHPQPLRPMPPLRRRRRRQRRRTPASRLK